MFVHDVQFRPSSSYNSPYWTTNYGAPVYNNNNSLTVGPRGALASFMIVGFVYEPVETHA